MAESQRPTFPPPSAEHRRIAVAQFERAQQVLAKSDHDYAIQLLLACCKLDPGNLIYRRHLRQTEKIKYKNNLRGSAMALITTSAARARMRGARRAGDFRKVLEDGEEVLTKNPWDTSAQLEMAEAAAALGLLDVAVWILEQARQKDPRDATVNRSLARFYEERGNFTQAIALWELVRDVAPNDVEAQHKVKDLAASDTIARGRYEQAAKGAPTDRPAEKDYLTNRQMTPSAMTRREKFLAEAGQYRTRIASDPTNPALYLRLATLFRAVDQFDDALAVLREGAAATGNDFDLVVELTNLEIEPFRRDLAVTDEKLQKAPEDEELRRIRAGLAREINARELELFRRKADRYPTEKAHHFELGVRLLKAGQTDEAIRELQALRTDPRFQWKSLMYLGHCFKARNNWRLAQRNFQDALQQLPPGETAARKDILFQLATGLAAAGELANAVELGNELANLDYGYKNIGRLVEEWQERLQET